MNTNFLFPSTHGGIDRKQRLSALLLLTTVILTTVHRQALGVDSLPATGWLTSETARVWMYFACTFVLFGLLPILLIKTVWKSSLADFGFRVGEWKFGLGAAAMLTPVIALCFLLPASRMDDMHGFYPVDKSAMDSAAHFVVYAAGRVFLFYVGWEILFRGYLLFGLRESVGDVTAICIQTIPSALWHIGYPAGELYCSIVAGLLFGWLALRTRSILWPLLLHAGIGVFTDLSISISL